MRRDQSHSHQSVEDDAAEAQCERRLEGGGDDESGDEGEGDRGCTEQSGGECATAEDQPDTLGEPLRRAGDEAVLAAQARRDHLGDEASEWAEPRAGEDPGEEAVGEWDEQPPFAHHEVDDTLDDDAGGDEAGRGLVDRVGETEDRHDGEAIRIIPIGQLRIQPGAHPGGAVTDGYGDAVVLRLTVRRSEWLAHVERTAAAYGDALVPVVKGNGYGFGRPVLHEMLGPDGIAAERVCVGTIAELADVPAPLSAVVLTPSLTPPPHLRAVATVGAIEHVEALRGWGGRVMVKLASSMRRYGVDPDDLPALLERITGAGLVVDGFAIHLPIAGDDAARLHEITAWLPHLPAGELWVSHITPDTLAELRAIDPQRRIRVRVGTMLWHGVPRGSFSHLWADVLQVRAVSGGDLVGYHHTEVTTAGWVVAVGAGSAQGIATLEAIDEHGPRSPFHFARRRLALLERPHMHTSLCFVPDGDPCPRVGDIIDVQLPLINVHCDEIEWRT